MEEVAEQPNVAAKEKDKVSRAEAEKQLRLGWGSDVCLVKRTRDVDVCHIHALCDQLHPTKSGQCKNHDEVLGRIRVS